MMRYDPRIHNPAHLVKAILGKLGHLAGDLKYGKEELLVVNYHSTPAKFIPEFRKHLKFYKKNFNIIKPSQLHQYYLSGLESEKCNLLITFDDGLKNNLNAVRVLDELGIKALFFIVPYFVDTPETEQKKYYLKNIRPAINSAVDSEEEDFTAMSWEDLRALVQSGHETGSHTLTHTMSLIKRGELSQEEEIAGSKSVIENKLGVKISSFCSINNTAESVGSHEKELIGANYKYHFTTLPGYNSVRPDPLFIKRRNVEVFWLRGSVHYALGKKDLGRWKKKIVEYDKL